MLEVWKWGSITWETKWIEPLVELDCFKYLGSQVAADGGCEKDVTHRMNEGYRAWAAQKLC